MRGIQTPRVMPTACLISELDAGAMSRIDMATLFTSLHDSIYTDGQTYTDTHVEVPYYRLFQDDCRVKWVSWRCHVLGTQAYPCGVV